MIALAEAGISALGKKVVVLGAAEEAARADQVELALAGASHLTIVNIPKDMALGEGLVARRCVKTPKATVDYVPWVDAFRIPADTDSIVVNATSIGLYPNIDDKPNLDYDTLATSMYVQDVIPNPASTPCGKQTSAVPGRSGLSMLINQAALNITIDRS